jgi:hypothetical protein
VSSRSGEGWLGIGLGHIDFPMDLSRVR